MKPNIRFNGFSDEWVDRKLGDVIVELVDKSVTEDQYDVLSSTVNGIELRKGRVSGKSNIGYKVLDLNQLVLSPQNLWLGNINVNRLIKGIVSPSYKVYSFNSDMIRSTYALYMLRTARMLNEYKDVSVQGASTVRRSLDLNRFYDIKCQLPTLPEQQKIGALFSKYDTIIALREQKLEELNALKKGLLKRMFPKNGTKVPELRFAGFADEWVERRLGDVSDVKYGHDYKNVSQIGNVPVYGTGGMLTMIDKCQSESLDAVGLGRKGTINKPFVLKAPFWTVDTLFQIYPKVSLDLFFELYLFNNINWLKYNESTGVPSLSKLNIEKVVRNFPSLPEQQKIGQLFKHLDTRILNEQSKIEQLKAQKQGLLQRVL